MSLLVLIGASGSGKTTIAGAIERIYPREVDVFHFDSIGVPDLESMAAVYGSGEGWQRAMTIEWMRKLSVLQRDRRVLFEGQTRLAFLDEGAALAQLSYDAFLIDCDDETRTSRLSDLRGQSELANPDMMEWAEYLRHDARARNCEILNTSRLSVDACITCLRDRWFP